MGRCPALFGTLVALMAGIAVFATPAGAVLVHVGPTQLAGVTPIRGVNAASIHGSLARGSAARAVKKFSANGNLDYNGGPVLHGITPYLVFWDPNGMIPAGDKALYARFFADSAAASGQSTNVWSVDRQFTDSTGFADYSQSWSPANAITDMHAFPSSGQCTEHHAGYTETACLYDAQLQAEVTRLVAAGGLPTGLSGQAPEYFIVTPPNVNTCFADDVSCADNVYCAYHSNATTGSGQTVLYANMATVLDANDPKGCQFDNNSTVQSPNGAQTADVNLKAMSHEMSETITDPMGNAWWTSSGCGTSCGNEDGDNCNFYGPSVNPLGSSNPGAFTPILGGTEAAGTLFNQSINGNPYYIQSEWSNGNVNCEMQPAAATLTPAFNAPANVAPGSVSLDPSPSASTAGVSSETWDFGDGTSAFSIGGPTAVAHTYSANGTYTVTLKLVDNFGNLSTVSHTVNVHAAPAAAFAASAATVKAGTTVSFNGSTSGEPGGTIGSYAWSFGDGASGAGAAPSHVYARAGTYSVGLTVTDSYGATAATTHTITVVGVPKASFTSSSGNPTTTTNVKFNGAGSSDIGSSISGYSWKFGDGKTGSGASVGHTFRKAGRYTVTLTVADASGQAATTTRTVIVKAVGLSVSVKTSKTVEKLAVKLSGAGTLKVGSKQFKIKQAETFRFSINMSKAQRTRLKHHHSVKLGVKLSFKPKKGKSTSETFKFTIKG